MTSNLDGERTDILAGLASARHFLRFAARDLTDEQARQRTTVSELSLGGLIKHVAATEQGWATFTLEGPSALGNYDDMSDADMARWTDAFRQQPERVGPPGHVGVADVDVVAAHPIAVPTAQAP